MSHHHHHQQHQQQSSNQEGLLLGVVQEYSWGKKGSESVAALYHQENCHHLGQHHFSVEQDKPYAELWFGSHPSAPSKLYPVQSGAPPSPLTGTVPRPPDTSTPRNAASEGLLSESKGTPVALQEKIPYLFKVLSIHAPLSLQLHPDIDNAERLHVEDPEHYPDSSDKPEMALAASESFEAFCGFRRLREIQMFALTLPAFGDLFRKTPTSVRQARKAAEAARLAEEAAAAEAQAREAAAKNLDTKGATESGERTGTEDTGADANTSYSGSVKADGSEAKNLRPVDQVAGSGMESGSPSRDMPGSKEAALGGKQSKEPHSEMDPEEDWEVNWEEEGDVLKHMMTALYKKPQEEIQLGVEEIMKIEDIESIEPVLSSRPFLTSLINNLKKSVVSVLTGTPEYNKNAETLHTALQLFKRLFEHFPYDRGLFACFFLNYVRLGCGDALALAPNTIHAYISGDVFECMKCSDNVIRAGLTSKFQDAQRLLALVEYKVMNVSHTAQVKPVEVTGVKFEPSTAKGKLVAYVPPMTDTFRFYVLSLSECSCADVPLPPWSPLLIFMVSGHPARATVTNADGRICEFLLRPGKAFYSAKWQRIGVRVEDPATIIEEDPSASAAAPNTPATATSMMTSRKIIKMRPVASANFQDRSLNHGPVVLLMIIPNSDPGRLKRSSKETSPQLVAPSNSNESKETAPRRASVAASTLIETPLGENAVMNPTSTLHEALEREEMMSASGGIDHGDGRSGEGHKRIKKGGSPLMERLRSSLSMSSRKSHKSSKKSSLGPEESRQVPPTDTVNNGEAGISVAAKDPPPFDRQRTDSDSLKPVNEGEEAANHDRELPVGGSREFEDTSLSHDAMSEDEAPVAPHGAFAAATSLIPSAAEEPSPLEGTLIGTTGKKASERDPTSMQQATPVAQSAGTEEFAQASKKSAQQSASADPGSAEISGNGTVELQVANEGVERQEASPTGVPSSNNQKPAASDRSITEGLRGGKEQPAVVPDEISGRKEPASTASRSGSMSSQRGKSAKDGSDAGLKSAQVPSTPKGASPAARGTNQMSSSASSRQAPVAPTSARTLPEAVQEGSPSSGQPGTPHIPTSARDVAASKFETAKLHGQDSSAEKGTKKPFSSAAAAPTEPTPTSARTSRAAPPSARGGQIAPTSARGDPPSARGNQATTARTVVASPVSNRASAQASQKETRPSVPTDPVSKKSSMESSTAGQSSSSRPSASPRVGGGELTGTAGRQLSSKSSAKLSGSASLLKSTEEAATSPSTLPTNAPNSPSGNIA